MEPLAGRLKREHDTLVRMAVIYCRDHHGQTCCVRQTRQFVPALDLSVFVEAQGEHPVLTLGMYGRRLGDDESRTTLGPRTVVSQQPLGDLVIVGQPGAVSRGDDAVLRSTPP